MEDYHKIREGISNDIKAIKLNPRDDKLYNDRGQKYFMIGQYDEAIADYTKAIELNPRVGGYYNIRGLLYHHFKGQYDKAIADYTKAIELNLIGQYDKAIADDAKAFGLPPSFATNFILRRNTGAYNIRGSAYGAKGEYDKAISDFNKAIELNPRNAEAYNGKAWILATCRDAIYRDGSKAVELAKKAVELEPEANRLDTLAAAYAEVGKFEDAIITQEKVIDLLKEEGQPKNMIDQGIELLKSYKARKPWREK
jgi:tetratricopeptide (TPR) repeat protein